MDGLAVEVIIEGEEGICRSDHIVHSVVREGFLVSPEIVILL